MRPIDLKSSAWFRVIAVATILTGLGWFGQYSLLHAAWRPGLGAPLNIPALLTFWLLMPGDYVAIGVAWLLLPGGLHNPEPFMWLAPPASWLFYFGIGALRIHLRKTSKVEAK